MQKITVKKFLGIQEVDIEIGKVLVIIGEQASGKSTLAKLIYFFQTLKKDIFRDIYNDDSKEKFEIWDLRRIVRTKFYDYFGSTLHLEKFEITYSYSNEKTLRLFLDKNNKLAPRFSQSFYRSLLQTCKNAHTNFFQLNQKDNGTSYAKEFSKFRAGEQLNQKLNELFELKQTDALYTIAGRNATVGYSDLFEKYLFSALQKNIEESKATKDFTVKTQNIEEILMLEFIEKISSIKDVLQNAGGFEGVLQEQNNANLHLAKEKIESILKGKYAYGQWGEKIIFNETEDKYVLLKNASSGQQESIRILQDLFLIIAKKQAVMRIFEEPEANLFPIAQKGIIELMALMLNSVPDSTIIITTHSPYVLSIINNLLFAGQIARNAPDKKKRIQKIIKEKLWLKPEDVRAYSLGNSYTPERAYFEDIFDTETGTIHQNYLDTVSEILGDDFYKLIAINNQ